MLNRLRRFHSSTANRVLYALLAAAFVLWGVGSFRGQSVDVVAEVRGTRITRHDLDRETAILQRRYEQLFKGSAMPRLPDLRGQALDALIEQALVRHEAKRLGLTVSDEQVVAAVTRMPELQEDGRFNRDLLARVLQAQRDRGEFEESIRHDLQEQRLRSLVTDAVLVSDVEVEERYRHDHEQVDLTFARVSAADLAKTTSPTDADLDAELAAHPERYRTPATVRARYLTYRATEFESLAAPTPEQVDAFYKQHLEDRFTDVEQVHARHILVKIAPEADDAAKAQARAEAEDLLKQVRGGADFAALATAKSQDTGSAAKGGDLGFFPRGRMVPSFEAAAFALEPGQVSEVVESPFGFHIIKLEEHRPGGPKPLDGVRDQIVKELTTDRALDLARRQADSDRRAIVGGKTLAQAAGSRPVAETAPFAANADVPGVGRVKPFTDAAFALDEGEVSDLIETDDVIYILSPFERREPTVPPLADIRAKVEADAKRTAGEKLAAQEGEALLNRAKEIGLDRAAAEKHIALDTTGVFDRRTAAIPKLGSAPDLRNDAFTMTTEAPLGPRVYAAGGDAVVVALKSRTPADMNGFAAAKDGLHTTLLSERQQAAIASFMDSLKLDAQREGALVVHTEEL